MINAYKLKIQQEPGACILAPRQGDDFRERRTNTRSGTWVTKSTSQASSR